MQDELKKASNDYCVSSLTTFQDVEDTQLRAWNQINIIRNLEEDGKNVQAYLERLPSEDIDLLFEMGRLIRATSREFVHAKVSREMTPTMDQEDLPND